MTVVVKMPVVVLKIVLKIALLATVLRLEIQELVCLVLFCMLIYRYLSGWQGNFAAQLVLIAGVRSEVFSRLSLTIS